MTWMFWTAFIVLFVLKIIGYIHISWWLVTLPLWIGIAITLIVFLGAIVGILGLAGVVAWISTRLNK